MKNLQVKNLPDSLHRQLKQLARSRHSTLSELVLTVLRRELERQTWTQRLHRRPSTPSKFSAADLLIAERKEHYGDDG